MKNRRLMAAAVSVFALMGGAAHAGSLADPVVDPIVITTDTSSSSSGTGLVALLSVLMMIPVLSD